MATRFLTLSAILSGFVIFLLASAGCASTTSAGATSVKIVAKNTIIIPKEQVVFSPFILAVQPNTTVTWQNETSDTHTITNNT